MLGTSLWLDETLTFWIVKDGFSQTLTRPLQFQGQAPFYYLLAWILHNYVSASPEDLRWLSIYLAVGSLIVFWLFAGKVLKNDAALFALLALVSLDSFQVAAVSARPYALALFFSLLASYALFSWLKNEKPRWLIIYILAATLSFYAHYIFGLVFLVHLAQVGIFAERPARLTRLAKIVICQLAVAVLCLPTLAQLKALAARADALELSASPAMTDFVFAWLPLDLMLYLVCAAIFVAFAFGRSWSRPAEPQLTNLIWAGVISPLLLFPCLHFFGGISLFHPRYLLWYLPFLAVAAAFLFSSLKDNRAKFAFAAVFSLLALVRGIDKKWQVENWRGASRAIEEGSAAADTLLLVNSGLVEFRDVANLGKAEFQDYLLAPFAAYPNSAQKLLIPFNFESAAGRDYLDRVVKPQLTGRAEFYLVSLTKQAYAVELLELGFKVAQAQRFGEVSLLKFKKGD